MEKPVKYRAWDKSAKSSVMSDGGCAYFTARLCSPMNMNSPARTLVGVKPSTSWRGELVKARMAPACKKALHLCS